jgi:hypothetical protein
VPVRRREMHFGTQAVVFATRMQLARRVPIKALDWLGTVKLEGSQDQCGENGGRPSVVLA